MVGNQKDFGGGQLPQPEASSTHLQTRGDTLLFQTRWISVKETKHGFHFAERAGRNSIALFLIRRREGSEPLVLIRWQRSVYGEDRDKNYPGPITGSIDKPLSLAGHAVEEAFEEAGYRLQAEELTLLTEVACSTQNSELCALYACDVTEKMPVEERERISWEPLSFLRTCEYSFCQLGFFLIQEMLSQQERQAKQRLERSADSAYPCLLAV